jgi:hypothetical protein
VNAGKGQDVTAPDQQKPWHAGKLGAPPSHLDLRSGFVARPGLQLEQEPRDGLAGSYRLDDVGNVLEPNATVGEVLWFDQDDRTMVALVEATRLTAASNGLGEAGRSKLGLELCEQLERATPLARWSRRRVRTKIVADE